MGVKWNLFIQYSWVKKQLSIVQLKQWNLSLSKSEFESSLMKPMQPSPRDCNTMIR